MGVVMNGIEVWFHTHFEGLVLLGIGVTWLQTYFLFRGLVALWRHVDARFEQLDADKT